MGTGIQKSQIPREEIWLTSKLDNVDHAPDRVAKACREQLEDLKTDYLDLYLIHWPLTGKAGPSLDPPIKVTFHLISTLSDAVLNPYKQAVFPWSIVLRRSCQCYRHYVYLHMCVVAAVLELSC